MWEQKRKECWGRGYVGQMYIKINLIGGFDGIFSDINIPRTGARMDRQLVRTNRCCSWGWYWGLTIDSLRWIHRSQCCSWRFNSKCLDSLRVGCRESSKVRFTNQNLHLSLLFQHFSILTLNFCLSCFFSLLFLFLFTHALSLPYFYFIFHAHFLCTDLQLPKKGKMTYPFTIMFQKIIL